MTTPVSPALQFVLAAVRRDGAGAEARAQAAASVTDWDAVVAAAIRHDVSWWVWRALPSTGVSAGARRVLEDTVRTLALRSLAGVRELLRIVRALDDAGVGVVAYKGPALAADVHDDVGARRFTDLDLLVAERDRAAARRALMAIGYQPPAGLTEREERFYSTWEGVTHLVAADADFPVEIHWRVQAPRYGGPQDPAGLVLGARRYRIGGGSVLLPAVEPQAVLLALHGVKHAWTSLLWVVDFAHAVARERFDWKQFDASAAHWGVARATHIALLVAHELVRLPVPADRLTRARGDGAAAALADDAVRGLLADVDAPNAGRASTPRYDLRWLGSVTARLRYLALAAALPTPQDRAVARLPDVLLPLAYPMRVWRLVHRAMGRRP